VNELEKLSVPAKNISHSFSLRSFVIEYLFQKEEKSGKSKIEAIEDHLRTLYEQYPDYRLYVTGQSLGKTYCDSYVSSIKEDLVLT